MSRLTTKPLGLQSRPWWCISASWTTSRNGSPIVSGQPEWGEHNKLVVAQLVGAKTFHSCKSDWWYCLALKLCSNPDTSFIFGVCSKASTKYEVSVREPSSRDMVAHLGFEISIDPKCLLLTHGCCVWVYAGMSTTSSDSASPMRRPVHGWGGMVPWT